MAPNLTSTAATGTAPFTVTSTTPVANLHAYPALYTSAGTQQAGKRFVQDGVVLVAGSATVTLTGSAASTSTVTYQCYFNNESNANPVKYTKASGSQFTITGTGTDTIGYFCIGH